MHVTFEEKNEDVSEDEGLGIDISESEVDKEKDVKAIYTPQIPEGGLEVGPQGIEIAKEEVKAKVVEEAPSIFVVKTALGHEKTVADALASRAKIKNAPIFAILCPAKIRGYVFMEGTYNTEKLKELIVGVQYAKGIVEGTTRFEEIKHFLTPKPLVSGIMEGDIVEIISGPFKGEKARVQNVDEAKEEITVELFEAMVSIPVTIKGDNVRVIEKEE